MYKTIRQKVGVWHQKANNSYINKVAWLTSLLAAAGISPSFAVNQGDYGGQGGSIDVKLPWDGFLNGLAKAMTGPFAITVGVMAIAAAAFALFKGNGGPATEKIIMVCFGVAIVFFAPTVVSYLSQSAGGLTI